MPPLSDLLSDGSALAFRQQRLRIDPRAQALVALLRHGLRQKIAEPLEAEGLALMNIYAGYAGLDTRDCRRSLNSGAPGSGG